MGAELWIPLVSALLGGGGLIGSLILLPKLRAEVRHINAQASLTEWNTALAKIAWLEREVKALRNERNDDEREKKSLRSVIRRLSKRVADLENILKVHPITPEMQAALDELDRKAGNDK